MVHLHQKPTQIMKKVLIIIAFLIAPLLSMAQTTDKVSAEDIKATVKTEVAIKKIDKISIDPKTQNLKLYYKKSSDIISIKAYIKTLQLKSKATLNS